MKNAEDHPIPQVELERLRLQDPFTNPLEGTVRWSPLKSLPFVLYLSLALVFAPLTIAWDSLLICMLLTTTTLCLGHSIGLHRLLIHRSFVCPLWLERLLVYLGVLVGMGGPYGMQYLHDIRDWAQRHPACHAFFIHRGGFWKDGWWNLHCTIELAHPPVFASEPKTAADGFYQFLEKTWRWQQLPLALVLFLLGGWSWVIWGICVRVPLCATGHWLIGYLAHNSSSGGKRSWHVHGHAVQGYNLPGLGLISMGESWHNNHHAYPESARHGHTPGQLDPGWWVIAALQALGLAREVALPENLPERGEVEVLDS